MQTTMGETTTMLLHALSHSKEAGGSTTAGGAVLLALTVDACTWYTLAHLEPNGRLRAARMMIASA